MKYVFYLLIALGAALYFPRSRAVIADFAEPAITPVLRWGTNNELERIAGDLQNEVQTGRGLPAQGEDFQAWLRDNYQGEDSRLDSWDGPYYLEIELGTFRVVSAGPDGERGTADDLSAGGRLPSGRR